MHLKFDKLPKLNTKLSDLVSNRWKIELYYVAIQKDDLRQGVKGQSN